MSIWSTMMAASECRLFARRPGIFGRSWSPDGSQVAIVWNSSPDNTTHAHLTLANAEGTEQSARLILVGEPLQRSVVVGQFQSAGICHSDNERNRVYFLSQRTDRPKNFLRRPQSINLINGADSNHFNVLWQDAAGDQWIDGFDANG